MKASLKIPVYMNKLNNTWSYLLLVIKFRLAPPLCGAVHDQN